MGRELNLYNITEDPISLRDNLISLRRDYDDHIHDGISSKTFQTLIAETVSSRVLAVRKNSYTDVASGLWAGLVGNTMKLRLGSSTVYMDWDGTTFSVIGGTITGGTVQTASSGARLVLTGSSLKGYSAGNVNRFTLSNDTIELLDSGGTVAIALRAGTCDFAGSGDLKNIGGNVYPSSGQSGVASLGIATNYWNDISYKTLTDRGCLGWFDEGVELVDGRKVSDIEAIKNVRRHPSLKTVYGVPRLDYSSMPKAVYKPVPIAQEDIYEKGVLRFKKGEKIGEDGAETTALISIMFGAIKELAGRVEELEKKLGVIPKPTV